MCRPAFLSSGGSVSIAPSPCCYLSPPPVMGQAATQRSKIIINVISSIVTACVSSLVLSPSPFNYNPTLVLWGMQNPLCQTYHTRSLCALSSRLRCIKCPIIISINNKRAWQIKLLNRFQILYFNWPPQPLSQPLSQPPSHQRAIPFNDSPSSNTSRDSVLLQHLLVRFAFVYSNSAQFLLNRTYCS